MMAEKTTKKEILNYVNFSLCVVLSFAGSFFTLARLGEIRTLFIVAAFAAANAFVKTKWYLKIACFGVFGYILHSFYGEGFEESLTCALFCAFVMLALNVALHFFKKKKAPFVTVAVVLIMSTFGAHFLLFGSPSAAFGAAERFDEYTEKNYIDQAVEKSEVRYDRKLGCFVCDINSVTEPTEVYTLVLKDGRISDQFREHIEISLMKGKRLEILEVLHKVFPNESFNVKSNSIQGYHFAKAGITDTEDRSKEMVFDIYIPAYLTMPDFIEKAVSLASSISDAGIDYCKINFYGGRAGKYFRRLTLLDSVLPQNTEVEFVPHCFADLLASRLIGYKLPGTEDFKK